MMTQAAPTHAAWCGHPYAGPQPDALFAAATTADLFALRQDAAGAPVGEMPRLKRPEAGTAEPVDIIVAAGAEDDGGAAANIVREGAVPNVVRPGAIGRWVTFQQARQELGV